MQNKFFIVVWINEKGEKLYFEHEECGLLDTTTHKTIKEPQGFFSPDLKDARKFMTRWQAEAVSAGYSNTHIETIKEGGC